MSAARDEFLRRSLVAGVASTVVMSLTALTVGIAPALAEPGSGETGVVETTVVEEPSPSAGGGGAVSGGRSEAEPAVTAEAPAQAATTAVAPAPTQAPAVTQAPAPTPVPTEAVEPTRAPEPVPAAPETVAPQPTRARETTTTRSSTQVTTTSVAPPETSAAPVTQEPATQQPRTEEARTETPTPSSEAPSDSTSTAPAATSSVEAPATSTTGAPAEATGETEQPTETEQVEPMARVIETVKPAVLEAPADDVVLASKAAPVEVKPEPAKVEDLAALSSLVGLADERDRLAQERRELREDQRDLLEGQRQLREDQRELRADQRDWDNRVRQWSPDWVQYDEFYRPMIVNPYRDPVRIVYEYQNEPRVVTIPPLQRMVMYVADLAAYSFTAVVLNTVNTVVSTAVGVAVGSFFGGGFIPTIANIGAIAPPPPPPLFRYDNVPVQVRYSDAVYEPFRVQRIVDIGDDTRYGERRVLLDGATPAWGVWKQSAGGERMFEVHRTQQYPGLDEPREGPLPGDYRLRLAAEEAPATGGSSQTALITAAVACAVLSLGAVGGAALLGRRRRI
ncbi:MULTISPECIES: cell division protein ZapB [Mycobacteriaceae]|uniref:Gram-positive cocci surface proteins LPxTG domain-containing protein n=1 Tax=Mycolicibacterium neoaurum VKM Ac-1815D TaxID=700508 RepID=V5XD94_MYCNE|nr:MULTISPECIES: hypothetical protein [Mycobacteriaceae]AXK74873.1 hypothetical protein DXK33_06870 [Mycolicibacterium neoaurum]KUM07278.1 hypothetical protein AVZ31_16480 [Mycolicibacterium neoaurum]WBP94246.1 hypothetical protein O7W24_24510 [Mycolicibacterium neoaurum]WBS06013.1 hypothetical protein O6072_14005 [Mycolicibacterium neoaurum]